MSDKQMDRREFMGRVGTAAAASVLITVLPGCGGGQNPQNADSRGRVQLTIAWPSREADTTSRYIPTYAESLFFELYLASNPAIRYTLTVNRPAGAPATQTVSFNQLLTAGTYVLAGVARLQKDGLGATVASAVTNVNVVANQTAIANLTLNTTIRTIEVLGQPLRLAVGDSLTLTGRALDPDGKTLFLPGGALSWSQVFGAEFGTVTPDGKFTALAVGLSRIRLSEPGANISNEANIQVVNRNNNNGGLAQSAWPKSRGDAQNTGRGLGSGAVGQKKWEFISTGRGVLANSPVIGLDGTIYIGSLDNRFYALDGATGQKKWEFVTGNVINSDSAIGTDGTIYVGSADGKFYALDGASGQKKWEFFAPGNGGYSSPAIGSDGTIYVSAPDTKFYALDGITGQKRWERSESDYASLSSPAIGSDGTIYIGVIGSSSKFYALDGASGQKKWEFASGSTSYSPAIGSDGTIYVGTSNELFNGIKSYLYALDSISGQKKWEFAASGPIGSSPAIGFDGTIYVAFNDNKFYALNGATGEKKWEFVRSYLQTSSSPAIGSDGTVYVGQDKSLYALNGINGQTIWSFSTNGTIYSSPAIGVDGTIYIAGGDNKVYAVV